MDYAFLIFGLETLWSFLIGVETVKTIAKAWIVAPSFAMAATFLGYAIIRYIARDDWSWTLILVATAGVGFGTFLVAKRWPRVFWQWLRPRKSSYRKKFPFTSA